MRYKVEVIVRNKIVKEYFFKDFSNPKQAARKVVEDLKYTMEYIIMFVANEYGEVWQMSSKNIDGQHIIRVMIKYGIIMNMDDVDLVFSRNKYIYGGVLQ